MFQRCGLVKINSYKVPNKVLRRIRQASFLSFRLNSVC